jgi:hypothetical protein
VASFSLSVHIFILIIPPWSATAHSTDPQRRMVLSTVSCLCVSADPEPRRQTERASWMALHQEPTFQWARSQIRGGCGAAGIRTRAGVQ